MQNTSPTSFEGSGTGKPEKKHKTLQNLKPAPKKQLGLGLGFATHAIYFRLSVQQLESIVRRYGGLRGITHHSAITCDLDRWTRSYCQKSQSLCESYGGRNKGARPFQSSLESGKYSRSRISIRETYRTSSVHGVEPTMRPTIP